MQNGQFQNGDSGRVRIVSVDHDIDIATRHAFQATLDVRNDDRPLVVDLSYCPYLDSSGLSALIRRNASGPKMAVVIPHGCAVERVFVLTCMDRILSIFAHLDQAIGAVSPEAG